MKNHMYFRKVYKRFLFICLLPITAGASVLSWDRTETRILMEPGDAEARADYELTNNGEDTLRIASIETSCGCTSTVIDQRILQPGESTRITAIFNKGKRRGKTHSKLAVFLEGNPHSVATLHMIVDIPELVKTQPSVVYWNKQTGRSPRTVQVSLDSRYVDTISAIRYDDTVLRLKQRELDNKNKSYELEIEPLNFDTPLRHSIEIEASGPGGLTGTSRIHVLSHP